MKKIFIFLISLFPLFSMGQTLLNPGEVIIVAINGDVDAINSYDRGFSFMPLVNLEAGTVINFTDYGWSDVTGSFITQNTIADAFIHYTAPTTIPAGTIIRCDLYTNSNFTFDYSYSGSGNNYLNIAGLSSSDELLVFQGTRTSPTFIFAATFVSTGWATSVATTGVSSGSGSALPGSGNGSVADLVDDVTALSFNQVSTANDNSAYSGPTTAASKADWLTRIQNYSNWTFNDIAPIPTPPSGPFVVSGALVAPNVTGISPTIGSTSGGTSVSITGTNFTGATVVKFGSNNAASFTVNSATSITATSPSGSGTVDVTVTTPGGVSTTSSSDQFTYATVPGVPTSVSATAGNAQASISFTAPASNGGSAITGYTVTSSPGGLTGTGATSPISVTGLTNGTAYTFTVTATNSVGTGSASTASSAVTPATVPGIPTSVSATAGNAQASVSFTAPASNGGSAITGYTVTSSPGGLTGTGVSSPITVTGLTNGTAYTFTVTATNSVGTGSASTASSAVTPATVPGTPTSVSATRGNGSASVSFTAPASNGGSAITGYTVTSSPGGLTGTGASSPITVTGLTNGTAYTFTVTATNSVGTGSASTASSAVTPATVPGVPTSVSATAGNAQASISFTVPASNGGSAITGYTVTSSPGGLTGTGATSPITVTGLTNGTAYTFTVTATNSVGTGSASTASSAVTPATVPGVPTSVSATAGNAQASVSFTAPASNGGSAITGYTVTSSPGGLTGTGSGSPITVTGLTNGTAYTFTVTATNSVGKGSASTASSAVTPATVPGVPTSVSATAGNAQASVSFTAPASNGGSAITGYTVTSSPGGLTGTGVSSPITVTGLTNGTAYTFTVTATNSVGTGSASTASSAVTPATVPGAPTSVSATAGNAQASVSFTVPASNGGSAIIGYTVTSSPGGLTGTGASSPITVTGLTNGTAYTFTVTATNSVGTGSASVSSTPITLPLAPTVTTQAVSFIASNTATGNGNITSLGVPNPTAHGVCWNTTGTPTTSNSKVDNGAASSTGAFTAPMTSLSANTTYYVRAYATNTAGTSYGTEVSFTTLVSNSAPTDISLSASSIDENVAGNSIVGVLSSTDPDAGNTFTYTLVAGAGDTDNASFNVSGGNLTINNSPDYELKNSYSIRLRTEDQGLLNFEKVFTITVNNLNETPSDISLSASSIDENVAGNSIVGALSSTDPDAGNTFTYTLVAGSGDTDNASFNISGGNLTINNSPDYELKNSYSIRLRTEDQGSLNFEKVFTITVNNLNEEPTDISLSASSIDENVPNNSTVGTLSSTDPDAGNTFTYSLVAGVGDTDNASFNISGGNLTINNSPDYELKNSYSIRLRTEDQGSLNFEKVFTITVNNLNEAPTDISLSASSIDENVPNNSTVGTLSSTDPDAGNTFTYTLVAGVGDTDNASFNIVGDSLKINNSPDYELKNSYSIRLRTTDQGSLNYEKVFTITINDLVENAAPLVSTQAVTNITEITATANGTILSLGVPNPTQHGVVWSTTSNPDITLPTKTTQGAVSVAAAFTSDITGLLSNTLYYVRAYATNEAGTSYGEEVSFTTLPTSILKYNSDEISIFPNPVKEVLNINTNNKTDKGTYQILSINGSVFKTGNIENGEAKVDVEELNDSAYLLLIQIGDKSLKSKIIKEIK